MKYKIVSAGAAAALGLVAATLGAGTAQAGTSANSAFYRNGHKVAYVIFDARNSGGPEYVDVGDLLRDNHYIWTEITDVTAATGRTSTCSAAELTWHGCYVDIPEGHRVRVNVYRLNSTDSDFLGEVLTRNGALPTA